MPSDLCLSCINVSSFSFRSDKLFSMDEFLLIKADHSLLALKVGIVIMRE